MSRGGNMNGVINNWYSINSGYIFVYGMNSKTCVLISFPALKYMKSKTNTPKTILKILKLKTNKEIIADCVDSRKKVFIDFGTETIQIEEIKENGSWCLNVNKYRVKTLDQEIEARR